jgi:hypothetical protein
MYDQLIQIIENKLKNRSGGEVENEKRNQGRPEISSGGRGGLMSPHLPPKKPLAAGAGQ